MYKENPFGNPDGSRASIDEIENSFITAYPYGIGFQKDLASILNKRVIVGAKGSGKTVYLRKIQSVLKERVEVNPSIYVDEDIGQNLNCTERIITFCDYYSEELLNEKWSTAWEIAILATVANKFLFNTKLQSYSTDEEKESIKSLLLETGLLEKRDFKYSREYSLCTIFQILLSCATTRNQLDNMLNNKCWFLLRDLLTNLLKYSPELYLFFDSIDLEYEHAPLHWLLCQKGLFFAVLSFLQQEVYGEKLHLIVTLRDNVFTSLLRSEHATKLTRESHMFPLAWNVSNIRYFLNQKISRLPDCYFISKSYEEKTIESWLSIDSVTNEFGSSENVEDFLIRHTRLVPRDIIIMCNDLAKIRLELEHSANIDIRKRVTHIIFDNSKTIGSELLTICAKNIAANSMPNGAGKFNYTEGFTAEKHYRRDIGSKLRDILSCAGSITFGNDILCQLEERGTKQLGSESFILDVLWQNRAIGYIEDGTKVFYGPGFNDNASLPMNKDRYIYNSCIGVSLGLSERSNNA